MLGEHRIESGSDYVGQFVLTRQTVGDLLIDLPDLGVDFVEAFVECLNRAAGS